MIEAAASGRLPAWAQASAGRREHIARVAALLDEWAAELGLDAGERVRWRAAGWLHDSLRDAAPETLRPLVPPDQRDLAGRLLHGPAAAARLREDGVGDEPLLRAVAFHTLGHPELDRLGRALYLADYLEPGRPHEPLKRTSMRARMPHGMGAVLLDVVAARVAEIVETGRRLRPETVEFWNAVVQE